MQTRYYEFLFSNIICFSSYYFILANFVPVVVVAVADDDGIHCIDFNNLNWAENFNIIISLNRSLLFYYFCFVFNTAAVFFLAFFVIVFCMSLFHVSLCICEA